MRAIGIGTHLVVARDKEDACFIAAIAIHLVKVIAHVTSVADTGIGVRERIDGVGGQARPACPCRFPRPRRRRLRCPSRDRSRPPHSCSTHGGRPLCSSAPGTRKLSSRRETPWCRSGSAHLGAPFPLPLKSSLQEDVASTSASKLSLSLALRSLHPSGLPSLENWR